MRSVYKVKEGSLSKWLECLYFDIYELSEGWVTLDDFGISPGMIDSEPTCSYDLTGIRYNGCSSSSSYVYYINLSICFNKREGASDKRYLLDGEGFTYYNNCSNLTIRFDLFLDRWSDVISLQDDFDFDFKVKYISESNSGEKLIDYKSSDGNKYKVKLDFDYDYLSNINSKVELVLAKQLKREYELNRIFNCDKGLVCFIRKFSDLSSDIEVYYDFIEGEIIIYDIVDFCSRLSLYSYKGLGISFDLPDSIKQYLIEWSYQQWGLQVVDVKLGDYRKNDKLIVLDSI